MDYLPVFLNLRDQLALVVGGGAVAARKVELLLKAHARVRVVAPRLHPELALYRDAGRIEHLDCEFEPRHFDGVHIRDRCDRPQRRQPGGGGGRGRARHLRQRRG